MHPQDILAHKLKIMEELAKKTNLETNEFARLVYEGYKADIEEHLNNCYQKSGGFIDGSSD